MASISYVPQVLDLVLYAGDGTNFRLEVTNLAGIPVPLTGTMLAQIREDRETPGLPDAVFTIDMADAAEGSVRLKLTSEETQGLANTTKYTGVWDLQWTPIDEEPVTLCQGKVECLPDVSH